MGSHNLIAANTEDVSVDRRRVEPTAGKPLPSISVAIPTCNKPEDVESLLDSLAGVVYPDWEILIIDQSDDARTQDVVDRFKGRLPRLAHHRVRLKGAARARNEAIGLAGGDIIAFIDDDCTVDADWLEQIARAFGRYPRAALMFGSLMAIPHDAREYHIPEYIVRDEHVLRGRLSYRRANGFGGSMYAHMAFARKMRLDAQLGTGGYFPSSEDLDYNLRALAAGYDIVETPRIVVHHHGARSYASGKPLKMFAAHAYAAGTVHMKLLRCGDMAALPLVVGALRTYLRHIALHTAASHRERLRIVRIEIGQYLHGLVASFELGVDRRHRLYKPPTGETSGAVVRASERADEFSFRRS